MFAPKTINKKVISPKKADTGLAETFEEGTYDSDLYVELGLDNGARDYSDVEARITATLQAGERQFKDPDSNFHAQLKANYLRLLKDKENAPLIHRDKKNKLQNRLKVSGNFRTQQPRGLDIADISWEQSLADLLDLRIEYKLENPEKIADILQKLDNQLLSHENSRKLLKASGADPQEALRGSIIDAMLSTVLLQLVRLPVTLAFSTAGAHADLSALEKSALREAGATNKTVLGEVLKPGVPSLSRGARIVKKHITADKVSPETKHALKQLFNQIKLLSKVSRPEEDTAAFEELKTKVYQQYQTMLEKKAYYKNLTSAGKKKYLNAALQVAGFLIQISGRAVGHAALLSVGAEQLTKFISLVVRPAIAVLSTVIENWYDERAIATRIQRQFNGHMQSISPGETATEEIINKLAHDIQDNFEPAPLANYHRLNENVFQPELLKLDEDIHYLESEISLLDQKSQARSLRELALIGKKNVLLQAYGSYIDRHSRKYIDFDRAVIEEVVSLIQQSSMGEADAIGFFESHLHAIFGLLARGEEKNNQLIGALNNAFQGAWGRTLMEVILPLAENKIKALKASEDFSDEMFMEGIYVNSLLESDRHFSKAYKNFRRQSELEKIQESIKQLRDNEANGTLDRTILSKRQAAEKKRIELSKRLSRKQKKRDAYQKDVAAFLARDRSGISHKGPVWWAIATNKRGVVSAVSRGLKDAPRRAFRKLTGGSDKPYQEGLIAAFRPFTSNMVLSPGLMAGAVIRESFSSPTPDVHQAITAPLEMLMASFSAEHTGREPSANNNTAQQQTTSDLPPKPSIFTPPSDSGPGLNQVTHDIARKSGDSLNSESPTPVREDMPTPAPRKDLSRHRRSAPSSEAPCRIIDPAELDLIEKGFDQLDQYKKSGGWGEYDIRYVHPADSNGNVRMDLRHPVSGQQVQMDISSVEQAQMRNLGAVAEYYAQETANQIADPDFQDIARRSLGLQEKAVVRAVTTSAPELSILYFDPVSRIEKSMKMTLEEAGRRVAKQMTLEAASTSSTAKAGDRVGKFISFISLLSQGRPQDAQSGIGYALDLVDTVEGAAMVTRQFSVWLEKLPFSRTVSTLIKLGTHDLIKAMSKAAPILAAVGVGLGIKSIIDLSRKYPNATPSGQKAIAADLFFAVTGTVGGVAVVGMSLAGLTAAGPAGLALAIVAAFGIGISYAVNFTAQTEDLMINAAKQGVMFLQKLQTPMTVKTEGGHTTITLHRPGSLRIEDGLAIFTPDPGSAQIQKVTQRPHFTGMIGSVPDSELVYGVYEKLETYMEVNEVSVAIPQTGSLTVLEASRQIKIKPVYTGWKFESKNYPEILELENLLETISDGNKRQKVFTTTLLAPMGARILTGFEVERGSSAPSRILSDRPYVRYDSDNASTVASVTIHGGNGGVTTGIPPQSVLTVGSTGGAVSVILPEVIPGKEILQRGTPKFEKLPNGQLRVSQTMRVREKTEQQIEISKQELHSNPFSLDYYEAGFNDAFRYCKASWVSRTALRIMLRRYLLWCGEILPSAAFISKLQGLIDNLPKDPVDPELLAAMSAVPRGQKLTDNVTVKALLLQYNPGIKNGYRNRSSLEAVEHVLNQRLQAVIQHGKERDGAEETWSTDINFNPKEDFTFSVNNMSSDNIDTYPFKVKKDGTFTQADKQTSARPVLKEPALALPQGIDESLYDTGQNIGTLGEPEYVYERHAGGFYKLGKNMSGVPQMDPVDTGIINIKRATRGHLRDLTSILRWAKAQQGAVRYYQRAHFDGPSITVEPDGYLATHYATSLRTGPNGSKTLFLRQIPSALTGFSVPDLPTQGEEQIYLTFDVLQKNIVALEATINRLKQHRSGEGTVSDGDEILSFDASGAERLGGIVIEENGQLYTRDNKLYQKPYFMGILPIHTLPVFVFSATARAYNEVIQIQAGTDRYFYRPKSGVLRGPLSADGQAVVYLGQAADGQDVYGLEDTTRELSQFTFDARGKLTRTHRFTRQLLKDYGILDPVAGPHWIIGRGGAKLRTVTTPLGGVVYVLEDVHGVTHTRVKGASSWTVGIPNTVSGLESVLYGFDIDEQIGVSLLRAQADKNAQFVGIKTDQVSPVRVEGGGNVLLSDDFNRPLTFVLSVESSNVLELNWSQWKSVPGTSNVTGLDSLTLINGHGGRVVIEFAPGAKLSVRDIGEEDFSLDARPYTSAQALAERLSNSTPDVALGTSNLGELYWDPLRKTLMAQQEGVTRVLGTLNAPVNYLDDAGTQVGIYADAPGNAIDLPTLGMETYEVGLGKSNKLTLSRSFVENARPQSGGETYVYPNLENLATGEHALVKLDSAQWPTVGEGIPQKDGSVTVHSNGIPPVVLRFIPPKGKRIQLSLQEGSIDTWKATVIDGAPMVASADSARTRYVESQTTWEGAPSRRTRAVGLGPCMTMPISLLRRPMRGRDSAGGREGGPGNQAVRVESVMQSNLRNAQSLETGGKLEGISESINLSSQSTPSGKAASSQASNPKNSGGQGLIGRMLTTMRGGESSSPESSSVSPLNVLALDRKIDSASKLDPAGYSFISYRAAFNNAKQAGVIDARHHEWLTNSVAKRGSNGEIIDSPHYREVFALQNKKPMTKFEHANIIESGFLHLGKRQPNGSVVYEHAVYVHVVGADIHLYQVNGSSFIVALNGSDGPNKHNNIGKNVSKSHYKHPMDAGRITNFNNFFEPKAGDSFPQPVFAFTPASDVRSAFARQATLKPNSIVERNPVEGAKRRDQSFAGRLVSKMRRGRSSSAITSSEKQLKKNFANGSLANSPTHPDNTSYRTKENLIASGSIGRVYKNGDRLMKDYTGFYDPDHPGRLRKAENNVEGLNRLYGEGAANLILRDTDIPSKKIVSVDMLKVPGQSLESILRAKNVAMAREVSDLYRSGGLVESLVGVLRSKGLVWNDINLANIMYDSKTKNFNLIDFDDAQINDLNTAVNDGQADRMSKKFIADFSDFERQTVAMESVNPAAPVQSTNNVPPSKNNPAGGLDNLPDKGNAAQVASPPLAGNPRPQIGHDEEGRNLGARSSRVVAKGDGANRTNQIMANVRSFSFIRDLNPEEQKVVDGGFVTKIHLIAISEAARLGNFLTSFRETGTAALSWINRGAATKPHSILEKTLKSSRVPQDLRQAVEASGLLGLAAHWDDGVPVGVFVTRAAALGWRKDGGLQSREDGHGNFYVPINFSTQNDPNLAALKSLQNWERVVITGDYDMHDNIIRGGSGGAHTAVSDSTEEAFIKNAINAAISSAEPTRVGPEHLMIQHGPQVTYPAHVMSHESARNQLVPAVARPSFPLAFCDNKGRWTIVNALAELQAYYNAHNVRLKDTWTEGGVSRFIPTGPGTVGLGRSAQSPSDVQGAPALRSDRSQSGSTAQTRYSAQDVKHEADGRTNGSARTEPTMSEVMHIQTRAQDFVLSKLAETVTIPNGLPQLIRTDETGRTLRTDIHFAGSGQAEIHPDVRGDIVLNLTNTKQVAQMSPTMLAGMKMFSDDNHFGMSTTLNGKTLRFFIPKNPAKGAIHVQGYAAPFIYNSEQEFRVGVSRGFKPFTDQAESRGPKPPLPLIPAVQSPPPPPLVLGERSPLPMKASQQSVKKKWVVKDGPALHKQQGGEYPYYSSFSIALQKLNIGHYNSIVDMDQFVDVWREVGRNMTPPAKNIDHNKAVEIQAGLGKIDAEWSSYRRADVKEVFRGDSTAILSSYPWLAQFVHEVGEGITKKTTNLDVRSQLIMSTSKNPGMGYISGKSIMWHFELEPGHAGVSESLYPSEGEVTFPIYNKMQIVSVQYIPNGKSYMDNAERYGAAHRYVIKAKISPSSI